MRRNRLRDPIIVHEAIGILRLMDTLKRSRGQLVLVADEFGAIEGLVTPIDVFEAIAGEFPDEDELPDIVADGEHTWKIDGAADLHHVEQVLETEGLIDEAQDSPRWPAICCRALAICPSRAMPASMKSTTIISASKCWRWTDAASPWCGSRKAPGAAVR